MGSILVTGGAGYIGGRRCVELPRPDTMSSSWTTSGTARVTPRSSGDRGKSLQFDEVDILDAEATDEVAATQTSTP